MRERLTRVSEGELGEGEREKGHPGRIGVV